MTGGKDGVDGTRDGEARPQGTDNEAGKGASSAGAAASTGTGEANKPVVLLVEDDPSFARSMRRLLSADYDTVHFDNGEAALQAIMQRSFDVVVSDIHMPGMTGVELLSAVRRYDLDVPVILMTGAPSIDTAIEAVSLGALMYLVKPAGNEVVLKAVERATKLHRVARIKRDALRLLGETATQAGDRAGLQASFEKTLETMWMAFQPIVDAPSKRIFGYEALMRSREPSLPHPGAILAAADRLERTQDLGRRVRALSAEAFAQAPPEVLLFVNLHTRDLLDPALYDPSAPLTRLAKRVVLEITERATIDGVKDVQMRVAQLRRLGFRIALDDLGAGYAGLSSFAALEPEIVKLDMSLVRDVHRSDVRRRLIGSMTGLCKEMGMLVVAEGVETVEERDCVRGIGCDLLQGYFYSKPGPPFPTVSPAA
jgi:EAL domain-containing protein (putative c-di-GMP-specific phosphodiesterase class I)/FixJ family two-component response regulator